MNKFAQGPWTVSEYGSQVLDVNGKVILEAPILSKYEDKETYKNNVKLASIAFEMAELLDYMDQHEMVHGNDIYIKIEEILNKLK